MGLSFMDVDGIHKLSSMDLVYQAAAEAVAAGVVDTVVYGA
jgi:hypothetical protein